MDWSTLLGVVVGGALSLATAYLLERRRDNAQGWSWARIGERVGRRDLKVLADTYTHVLIDETEVDYAALLSDAIGRAQRRHTHRQTFAAGNG
jgi:hypothetical protein